MLASSCLLQVTLHLPDVGVTAVSVLASFLLTGQVVIRSAANKNEPNYS